MFSKCDYDYNIKGGEMAGACSKYENMRNAYKVLVVNPEKSYHLKDLGVNGDNIKMKVKVTVPL
jgi:hypothetical protein